MVFNSGIHIERELIFGSYAKGKTGKWSDIDVALVSEGFTRDNPVCRSNYIKME